MSTTYRVLTAEELASYRAALPRASGQQNVAVIGDLLATIDDLTVRMVDNAAAHDQAYLRWKDTEADLAATERERAWIAKQRDDTTATLSNIEEYSRALVARVTALTEQSEKRLRGADNLRRDLELEHIRATASEELHKKLLLDLAGVLGLDPNHWDVEGYELVAHAAILPAVATLVAERSAARATAVDLGRQVTDAEWAQMELRDHTKRLNEAVGMLMTWVEGWFSLEDPSCDCRQCTEGRDALAAGRAVAGPAASEVRE